MCGMSLPPNCPKSRINKGELNCGKTYKILLKGMMRLKDKKRMSLRFPTSTSNSVFPLSTYSTLNQTAYRCQTYCRQLFSRLFSISDTPQWIPLKI
jgi:hypothetical protein